MSAKAQDIFSSEVLNAAYVFTWQGLQLATRIAGLAHTHIYAPQSLRNIYSQHFPCQETSVTPGKALTGEMPQHPLDVCRPPRTPCPSESILRGTTVTPPPPVSFFSALPELIADKFHNYACHIFIGACGIAVRAISPHLVSKLTDPAVLVIDQQGKHVISLLSGHTGGANHMAVHLARHIGAQPVITTASDLESLPALDVLVREKKLSMANPKNVKAVTSALLGQKKVLLHDPEDHLELRNTSWDTLFTRIPSPCAIKSRPIAASAQSPISVIVTEKNIQLSEQERDTSLVIHPPVLFAGIGCKRDTPAEKILDCIYDVFSKNTLSLHSLGALSSLDAKKEETGLIEAARALQTGIIFFSAEELSSFPVTRVSPKAQETFGVRGVCEPAALAAASHPAHQAELIICKMVSSCVTIAVAIRKKVLFTL